MAMWLVGGQDFANGQLQILQIANRQSQIGNHKGLLILMLAGTNYGSVLAGAIRKDVQYGQHSI
jgi:hypothetical protein